jgi:hypothetical protein
VRRHWGVDARGSFERPERAFHLLEGAIEAAWFSILKLDAHRRAIAERGSGIVG